MSARKLFKSALTVALLLAGASALAQTGRAPTLLYLHVSNLNKWDAERLDKRFADQKLQILSVDDQSDEGSRIDYYWPEDRDAAVVVAQTISEALAEGGHSVEIEPRFQSTAVGPHGLLGVWLDFSSGSFLKENADYNRDLDPVRWCFQARRTGELIGRYVMTCFRGDKNGTACNKALGEAKKTLAPSECAKVDLSATKFVARADPTYQDAETSYSDEMFGFPFPRVPRSR